MPFFILNSKNNAFFSICFFEQEFLEILSIKLKGMGK
jgi:hypothetical protein